jgi:hypothetical protein
VLDLQAAVEACFMLVGGGLGMGEGEVGCLGWFVKA